MRPRHSRLSDDEEEKLKKLMEEVGGNDDADWLRQLVNHRNWHEMEFFLQCFPEEDRNDDETKEMVLRFGPMQVERMMRKKKEAKKVDYSHSVVAGSYTADEISGSNEYPNKDITPMKEYDEDNAVNRGNVFFIPALSKAWVDVFAARGGGLTVVSFGVQAHDCTVYLLFPTPIVEGYTQLLQQDEPQYDCAYYSNFCTPNCEDTNFNLHIEGLKKWAPPGTRFVKKRVNMNNGLPDLYYQAKMVIALLSTSAYTSMPPAEEYENLDATRIVGPRRINGFLDKFAPWWNKAAKAWREDIAKPREVAPKAAAKVKMHVPGGVILDDGKVVLDDSWGNNPYKSNCAVM